MKPKLFENASQWLRQLNHSLRVGALMAIATASQCNYVSTSQSGSGEVTCCEPVENIEDCPCIVIVDVGEG